MKTIVLDEPGKLRATSTEEPAAPGAGEALVSVRTIGVCGTDYHAYRGRQPFFTYPRILGHELGVEVLEVGPDVANVRPGDRCAVEPYLNCGRCRACRAGRTNCCATLQVLGVHTDGGMRERIVVPAHKLHRSDSLSLEQLALVETLGIGAHAVSRSGLTAADEAVVIGAGPIGLAVTQFALAAGARVLVLDVSPARLDFCRTRLGATDVMVSGEDLAGRVRERLGGELPSVVFDATGSVASMEKSFELAAQGGRLVFVGLVQAEVKFWDPEFHRREITLSASRNSSTSDFRGVLAAVESGRIDTRPWITHRAPLDGLLEVFPQWLDPATGVVKALVTLPHS
ncbi:MAG: zinc-binding alcohol dehydrogenase family protein [Pirellulales bacterium]